MVVRVLMFVVLLFIIILKCNKIVLYGSSGGYVYGMRLQLTLINQ